MELLSSLTPNVHHETLRCLQTAMKSKMNNKECLESIFVIQLESITDAIAQMKTSDEAKTEKPASSPPTTPLKSKVDEDAMATEILGHSKLFDDAKSSAIK